MCMQYATWEEQQKDFRRARSVWERALDVSYTNPSIWVKVSHVVVWCFVLFVAVGGLAWPILFTALDVS